MFVGLSGAHGTGKTTLAHSAVALLKERAVNVGLVTASARSSHYLIANNKAEEMHFEVVCLHLLNETRAKRIHNVVLSDRTIYDYVTYYRLRFSDRATLVGKCLDALSKEYSQRYESVLVLKGSFGNPENDVMRASESLPALEFEVELLKVLEQYRVNYHVMEDRKAALGRLINEIK